jgi:tetratricopeptide (TPR) repeat protein
VAVGGLGDEAGATLTMIGDVARLATLLQAHAAPGMLLCSAATASLVRDIVCLEMAEPVPDEGQTTPVTTYQILGPHPQRQAVAGRGERVLSRFVGRAQELALLHALLAQAETGRGQVVGLVGEPGMGKSRLLFEFRQHLRSKPVTSVAGECLSYGQAMPYLPVLDILRSLCGLTETDSGATLVTKVQNAVQAAGLEAADWAPPLLHLLGVQTDTTGLALPPPDVLKSRTFEALRQMTLHRSQQQPLVITIDNLHWIDPTSEEYLASLVQHLAAAPLLLLVTYRPGYRPSWIDKSYATQLALQPLDAQDSRTLLQESLRSHPVPDALIDTLLRTAEGNPFFLEELAWTVVEQGVATPTLAVPDTVQAVVAARIDRLPLEAKTLLQTAAAIGKEVPLSLLQAVTEQSEDVLRHGLAQLQGAEFLYETRLFPEAEYTFKHALTHEVAYGSLLQERRRALHARIVEALEALYPERLAEQAERLASHALRGAVWQKALTYCRQAGAKALAGCAYREAVEYLEQALEALAHLPPDRTTLEQAVDVRCDLNPALQPLAQWGQLLTHLRDAEPLAEALADQRRLSIVSLLIANTLRNMQDYEPAWAYCQRAHAMVTALGDGELQRDVNLQRGVINYNLGDYRQALTYVQQNLTIRQGERCYELFSLVHHPSAARTWMVMCLSELGAFADGVIYGNEALQMSEAVGRPYERLAAYWRVGSLHVRQGTLHQAIPLLERGVTVGHEADIPLYYRLAAVHLALAYALAGRATDALSLLGQIEGNSVVCGEAYLLAGCVEEADRLAQRGLAHARDHKMRGNEARALWLLGEIALHRDQLDLASAEIHYQQALALAEELGMRPLQAHCHHGLGTLYARLGRQEQARTELATAIELYRAMDMTFWLPQAEAVLEALA